MNAKILFASCLLSVATFAALLSFPFQARADVQNTGTLTVCKMIIDQNGSIATSSANLPLGYFGITFATSTDIFGNPLFQDQFNTPSFAPNQDFVLSGQNDVQCYTHSEPLGTYYYSQEDIAGNFTAWTQFPVRYFAGNQSGFTVAGSAVYDATTTSNDSVTLSSTTPDQVVVMVNGYQNNTASTTCTLSPSDFESDVQSGSITYQNIVLASGTAALVMTNHTNCNAPINLSAYKAFVPVSDPHWLSTQVLFDVASSSLEASSTQTYTVSLPGCKAQVDAWYGSAPVSLVDTNPYLYPLVPFVFTWQVSNDPLCTTGTTTSVADVSIIKTVDNPAPHEGDTIHYTLTVSALGPATSTGVAVSDTLPAGLTFESASSTIGSYATSTGMWTIGDMTASTTATLNIAASVNTGTAGQTITNTAVVSENASTTDNNTANNTSSVPVTVATNGGGGGCTSNCGGGNGGGGGGTISVCLVLETSKGILATSSAGLPNGVFSMNLATTSDTDNSTIDTASFAVSSFAPNRMLISSGNDTQCVSYTNMPLGTYYYSPATTTSNVSAWNTALYNDQFDMPVNSLSDFFAFATSNPDSDGQVTLNSMNTEQTIVILEQATNTPPVITVLGDNPYNITVGQTYVDPGATASDLEDGNLTSSIIATSTVNTATAGTYAVTYSVTDSGGLTATATRSVIVSNPNNGGGGGGGGNGCTSNCGGGNGGGGGGGNGPIVGSLPPPSNGGGNGPIVPPATTTSTGGSSSTCYYLYDYLHVGWNNDPNEVKKLQVFLHDLEGYDVQVTGVYDAQTVSAVDAFQVKYAGDILEPWDGTNNPSGFTYILTKKKVNEIYCNEIFPLTADQQQTIATYRAFVHDLNANGVNVSGPTPAQQQEINTEPNSTSTAATSTGIGFNNGSNPLLAIGAPTGSPLTNGLGNAAAAIVSFPWNWIKGIFDPHACTIGRAAICKWLDIIILIIVIAVLLYIWYRKSRNDKGDGMPPTAPLSDEDADDGIEQMSDDELFGTMEEVEESDSAENIDDLDLAE